MPTLAQSSCFKRHVARARRVVADEDRAESRLDALVPQPRDLRGDLRSHQLSERFAVEDLGRHREHLLRAFFRCPDMLLTH